MKALNAVSVPSALPTVPVMVLVDGEIAADPAAPSTTEAVSEKRCKSPLVQFSTIVYDVDASVVLGVPEKAPVEVVKLIPTIWESGLTKVVSVGA